MEEQEMYMVKKHGKKTSDKSRRLITSSQRKIGQQRSIRLSWHITTKLSITNSGGQRKEKRHFY